MAIDFSIGRLIAGAITGAILTTIVNLGGVWWVVDTALSGTHSSIETTNKRIDDIQASLKTIDDRLFQLQGQINRGFTDTQNAIRERASLELPKRPGVDPTPVASVRDIVAELSDPGAALRKTIGPATVFVPTAEAVAEAEKSGKITLREFATQADIEKYWSFLTVAEHLTYTDLLNQAKNAQNGEIEISTEGGMVLRALVEDGKLVIRDQAGNQATVVRAFQGSAQQAVYSVDSLLAVQ